jgi:hypothetical protein
MESDKLFNSMLRRIYSGKTPSYFMQIYTLYYDWKKYILVSSNEQEIVKHVLQYHFMTLANLNDLYECWVFCKILYAIAQICDIRFKEIRSSIGLVDFKGNNDTFHVIYQRRYNTDWRDQDKYMEDIPDIAIEFKNGKVILIDTKSAIYTLSHSKPNRRQMRSYMTTLSSVYRTTSKLRHIGIFVHLGSEDPALSEEMIYKRDEQKIIWKSMVPGDNLTSTQTLESIIQLVIDFMGPEDTKF